MYLELCYRQPNNFSGVLKQKMNSSWAKEQNAISCYQFNDLGLPWKQFESLWSWKSPLWPSRNFWKVARMKYIIIQSGHKKFQEIRPENMALDLIWSCQHDKCLSEFDGVPCRHQSAWRQDGDRHTGDTNSIDVCRLYHFMCILRQFFVLFWHFFHLQSLLCIWCQWRGCVP